MGGPPTRLSVRWLEGPIRPLRLSRLILDERNMRGLNVDEATSRARSHTDRRTYRQRDGRRMDVAAVAAAAADEYCAVAHSQGC